MPSFRCPKCHNRLTADGSTPTVTCGQCGQLCGIPKVAAAPIPTVAPPPIPTSPAPLRMDLVMDLDAALGGAKQPHPAANYSADVVDLPLPPAGDEVVDLPLTPAGDLLDVVPAAFGDDVAIMDVVAADERGADLRTTRKKKKRGVKKRRFRYQDEAEQGWINPTNITLAFLVLFGLILTFITAFVPFGAKVLIAYGFVVILIAAVWLSALASREDGSHIIAAIAAVAFFPFMLIVGAYGLSYWGLLTFGCLVLAIFRQELSGPSHALTVFFIHPYRWWFAAMHWHEAGIILILEFVGVFFNSIGWLFYFR